MSVCTTKTCSILYECCLFNYLKNKINVVFFPIFKHQKVKIIAIDDLLLSMYMLLTCTYSNVHVNINIKNWRLTIN